MNALLFDLRYALRRLRRQPGFSLLAVLVVALGVGAVTTIYSAVDAVLLRPLDYPDAHELVLVNERERTSGEITALGYPTFADLRDEVDRFAHVTAVRFLSLNLTGLSEPEQLRLAEVSSGFAQVMGVDPLRGRMPDAQEQSEGAAVTVIGHELWQRQLGGSDDTLGSTIQLDGAPYTVIGIMPPGFQYPSYAQVWLPLGAPAASTREDRDLSVIARLAAGATVASAQAAVDNVAARLAEDDAAAFRDRDLTVSSLHDVTVGTSRATLLALFAAVGGVLLIACLNVATLQTMRGLTRHRELAVRKALGADHGRVLRQLMTESLVIAVTGGVCGVLLSFWGLDALVGLAPDDIPRLAQATLNVRVLGLSVLVTVATGVLFGLAPALRSTRVAVGDALRRGSTIDGPGRGVNLRDGLVVAQVALALVLLTGAGLLARSYQKLTAVDLGYDAERVVTFGMVLPPDRYPEGAERVAFIRELRTRIGGQPGVEAVSTVNFLPSSNALGTQPFEVIADNDSAPVEIAAEARVVSPGYFRAMGISLRGGRGFDQDDDGDGAEAVVISEQLARRYWPDGDAVGGQLRWYGRDGAPATARIVGVVGDLRYAGPRQPAPPVVYRPYAQSPWRYLNLVVRVTGGPPERLVPSVQETIWSLDSDRPLFTVGPMRDNLQYLYGRARFSTLLLTLFAGFALLLSSVGIYGVLAFAVARRGREIGIRLALGARRAKVRALVVSQGLRLAVVGVVLGGVGALAATRLLEGLLFEVERTDATTFVAVASALFGAAYLAADLPARRASQVDPMVALRDD